MAYSPIEHTGSSQRSLLENPILKQISHRHGATPSQVALAWLLRSGDCLVIPKAARPEPVRENRAALDLVLTEEDLRVPDGAFPPPRRKTPLAMR
ncbi:aldo/keto reductase [Larkinella soli]|uniref:aldo/keto reductase n=1 Tax=Larkinella soli TaxID=1770527 RepID=UPI001E36C98E|nr:aldo/keto reductase [Larkinella soli]